MNYIVRGGINPKLILTTTGDLKPEILCGPGGYCAKVYKTRAGAERSASAYGGTVDTLSEDRC